MKTFVRSLILLAIVAFAPAAHALTRAQIPTKIGIPWANSAGPSYIRTIPTTSQIGIQNCAASFPDGFPPLTFTPPGAGGCPPFGQDFNGILNAITLWNRWASAGGPMPYDSSFQTAIGGYPQGALVQSSILLGRIWYSTADNNLTNPDDQTGGAVSWVAQPGTYAAGTPIPSFSATPPLNTVNANGNTVGNAASNATNRASADSYWLFVSMWTNCSTCLVFNSSGSVVARGGTAAADWAANRAIATVDMRGSGFIGADAGGTTRLAGVPVASGSTTTGTSVVGENVHTLLTAEIPAVPFHTITGVEDTPHTHQYNSTVTQSPIGGGYSGTGNIGNPTVTANTGGESANHRHDVSGNISGGGGAHNTVERSVTGFWALSL